MSLSAWLCTSSTKKMLVKIVHPGGHVELHDSPLLAAELMLRNPRCCVAHPHIFQQPWAIVAPDTMLRLGQKYYVVPISTIRKLQRLSLKHSPTSVHEMQSNITPSKEDQKSDDMVPMTGMDYWNHNFKKLVQTKPLIKWHPPPLAWLKLNFDGYVRNNYAVVGFVIRYSGSHVLLDGAKNIGDVSITVAECTTLRMVLPMIFTRAGVKLWQRGTPRLLSTISLRRLNPFGVLNF
ncbi:PREDICTED: Protein of unknown function DUF4228 [Prunus dulcis]|uniref:Uncharacterized protein n=1 Tax=Prunus dulcis TaxID=3755 RepID=A0A5E4EW24_PRUDU|nr:PREDICTED: Protein of unknown function DUF4228 [Prunus dulcis]